MAVEDHAVHEKVRHGKVKYGCWNASREQRPYTVSVRVYSPQGDFIDHGTETVTPTMSSHCRHTGEYSKDPDGRYSWKDDTNCDGCDPSNKDHEHIAKMRHLVEQEMQSL